MSIWEEMVERYPALAVCKADCEKAAEILVQCYRSGGKLLTCGNGGSAADSAHIVGELMKGFRKKRPLPAEMKKAFADAYEDGEMIANCIQQALPAIALTDQAAIMTAYVNDVEPDMVYAQLTAGYAVKGDVLIGITTSGNSRNVVNAAKVAKLYGMKVIGLAGEGGGKLAQYCDALIAVPATETYQVQEYHLPVYHALCSALEDTFFSE